MSNIEIFAKNNHIYPKNYLKKNKLCFYPIIFLMILQLTFAQSNFKQAPQKIGFKKNIKNYSSKYYNQLWANETILQDKRGIIYIGNLDYTTKKGNLVQFDGVSWRVIKGPKSGILSMAMDEAGTIYIGGHNQIGFFLQGYNGTLHYHSLDKQLNKDKKNFSYVSHTLIKNDEVYFNCEKFLFRFNINTRKFKVLNTFQESQFSSSFICNGEFYFHLEKVGLMRLENDELKLVPGLKKFKDLKVTMMLPYNTQNILIGTQYNGLYLYNGYKYRLFPSLANEFLSNNRLNHGIWLSCGIIAMGTTFGGLIIIDSQGIIIDIIDKSYGLQDNEIYHVFEDKEGNLWLAMGTGISRIEYISPISTNNDLSLFFNSIINHHGKLYAGTDNGLYQLSSDGKFQHISGTSGYFFELLSIDKSLFAATSQGIYQLHENKSYRFYEDIRFFSVLHSQRDKGRIWAGGMKGLFSIYKKSQTWKKESPIKNINQRIESIVEDEKGNLWLGLNLNSKPSNKIVAKVEFPTDKTIHSPVITNYRIADAEISHYSCHVFKAAGHIIFSTEKGLFRFDENNQVFIPDLTFGSNFTNISEPTFYSLKEDKNKNIWINSFTRFHLAKYQGDGTYVIHSKPFRRIQSFYGFPLYPDPHENIIWIGGKGKLIRYDPTVKKNYHYQYPTLIRRVLANGNLIYDGNQINIDSTPQYNDSLQMIQYNDRNLSFEFAAPYFTEETRTKYRYILEGYDKNWSNWDRETKKEYNSLKSGLYRFRVQSKNVYQHPGKEAIFQFRILLPWYRTGWAFLSYAVLLFIFTYLIIKWKRSYQLEKEKQTLEQTVNERTKEIQIKNQQLEEQSEKLLEMDKVKSRFFANISHEFRTPLTLIIGPLEQVLAKFKNKELQKKLNTALLNSQRLLGLINQLLDLSKLDSGKMKLHAYKQNIVSFLKGIIASFDPIVELKGLDLTFNSQEESIALYFDPEKLEHVIINLLANAIKFTPAQGQLIISVTKKSTKESVIPAGLLEISVRDTGPGIPRDELENIFDRFYQADSIYEKHPKGTGIGLALAKELVELHRGELKINSIQGKGAEFIIQLPMGDAHLKAEDIINQGERTFKSKNTNNIQMLMNIEKEKKGIRNNSDRKTDISEDASKINEEDNSPLKSRKNIILVVEDNADLLNFIKESLEPIHTVIAAKNGLEGIQKAQKIIPDLIISDIMMPGVDGYQLCDKLKNDIKTSHIPIILLTAKSSEESIVEGFEKGADDYITKPFSTKILIARIQNLIDLRHQLQQERKKQITLQPKDISVSSPDEVFFKEVQEVIEKNLSQSEYNVEKMAKSLYLSRSSLYRKILALTGETPQQFIRTYRLKRAAQLLKANYGNVTEVAQAVGFTNLAYFAQCFKNEFQQLPSHYHSPEVNSKNN